MKELVYERAVNLSKLHDELLAALPELRPVDDETPVMTVEGDDTEVRLTIPEGVDLATIEAVVSAHDAIPLPEPDHLAQFKAEIAAAVTIHEIKAALLGPLLKAIEG